MLLNYYHKVINENTIKHNFSHYTPPSHHFREQGGKIANNDRENCYPLAKHFENLYCEFPEAYQDSPRQLDFQPPTKEEVADII